MIIRPLVDRFVRWRYLKWGYRWGDASSYEVVGCAMGWGRPCGIDRMEKKVEKWEAICKRRGLPTYTWRELEMWGGYGEDLPIK